jgi:hypothetical protein
MEFLAILTMKLGVVSSHEHSTLTLGLGEHQLENLEHLLIQEENIKLNIGNVMHLDHLRQKINMKAI